MFDFEDSFSYVNMGAYVSTGFEFILPVYLTNPSGRFYPDNYKIVGLNINLSFDKNILTR